MTVIQFPKKTFRPAVPATTTPRSWPEGKLTVEEVFAVTYLKMPEELVVDEADCLTLEAGEHESMSRFFRLHGLQLPDEADADTAYEIWRDLTLNYDQAVRLAAEGRQQEIPRACPHLTLQQQEYCVAAGRQDTAAAAALASQLFFGRHRSAFQQARNA